MYDDLVLKVVWVGGKKYCELNQWSSQDCNYCFWFSVQLEGMGYALVSFLLPVPFVPTLSIYSMQRLSNLNGSVFAVLGCFSWVLDYVKT